MKKTLAAAAALTLIIAGCGGSDTDTEPTITPDVEAIEETTPTEEVAPTDDGEPLATKVQTKGAEITIGPMTAAGDFGSVPATITNLRDTGAAFSVTVDCSGFPSTIIAALVSGETWSGEIAGPFTGEWTASPEGTECAISSVDVS